MNFRQPNEDLFESSRMSFGEHLEELRKVLFRAMWGIVPACVFGFMFANQIVKVLEEPLVEAMGAYRQAQTEKELILKNGFIPPEYKSVMDKSGKLPRLVEVDPAQFLPLLRRVIPELGNGIDLDPYGFQEDHFKLGSLRLICQKLETQTDSDQATSDKLTVFWDNLSADDRSTIEAIAANEEITNEHRKQVVTIFNRLARVDNLSDAEAFKDELTENSSGLLSLMLGGTEEKPLAKLKTKLVEEPDEILARRLNRALVTGAFAGEMQDLQVDLYPFEFWEDATYEPQSLGVTEGFMVWLKAGIFTGLILSGPWIFYQLWTFVATGLYPHERKYIHIFLPISIGLFCSGVALAYFFVFAPVLQFLFSFNQAMGIAPDMRINEWLSFVMFLPLGFGLAFQLPLVMLFMHRIGLFGVEDYLSKWRIAVMIIFVLAMFLTPADPISMLLLAVPLTGLYFMGIGLCRWMPRIQNPYAEDVAASTE